MSVEAIRDRSHRRRSLVACALASVLGACSSGVPKPPLGPVPPSAFTEEVPYPPPPAHVEIIPPMQRPRDVWMDGQWDWDGKGWKWLAGAWTTSPPGAYFTGWSAHRRRDGKLFFARASWRNKDGRALDVRLDGEACPIAPAKPAGSELAKR